MTTAFPRLVSIPVAARDILGVGTSTAYEWARTGQLPGAVRINSRWYCKTAEILKWLGADATAPNVGGVLNGVDRQDQLQAASRPVPLRLPA